MIKQERLAKFTGRKAELMRRHYDGDDGLKVLYNPDGSLELWWEHRF